jgi:hypothetical protein
MGWKDDGAIEIPITTSAVDALPPHVGHFTRTLRALTTFKTLKTDRVYQCNRLADRPLGRVSCLVP